MQSYKEFIEEAKIVGRIDLPKEVNDGNITKQELDALEKMLDKLFASIGLDVEFTGHFLSRVNDQRNKTQITIDELRALFTKTYSKYKSVLQSAKVDWEAVLKDVNSNVNVPFVINYDSKNKELDLTAKTVMRKSSFKSPDKILTV